MADPKIIQLRIDSILGGESRSENYSRESEYYRSVGIDPDFGRPSSGEGQTTRPSGYLVPVNVKSAETSTAAAPLWIVTNPKNDTVFVYDNVGSVYTTNSSLDVTGLSDLNDAGSSTGNGAEYYDNYIHFARATTTARYGPLNGAPTFTDDYWVGVLGMAQLTNTTYPSNGFINFPNHVMKRHTNGRLYITDVVGNQGVLHYIATTKTTVEGDTNDGSTFNDIDFPYGFWPTSMDSYGTDMAIALYEGSNSQSVVQSRAKIAFWDTVAENFSKIVDFGFPDPFISKIINVNGFLHTFSGIPGNDNGIRVCRYLGGDSFEQIAVIEDTVLPPHGAVDHTLSRIFFGTQHLDSGSNIYGSVRALGSQLTPLSGIFNVSSAGTTAALAVTALKVAAVTEMNQVLPMLGWHGTSQGGIAAPMTDAYLENSVPQRLTSKLFSIGQRFKVLKVAIPFSDTYKRVFSTTGSKEIYPILHIDSESVRHSLVTISEANYPLGERRIVQRPTGVVGVNNLRLELRYNLSDPVPDGEPAPVIALPIIIDVELLDD